MDTRVPFFRLLERVSEGGKTYFVGYLGDAKVIVFKDERCEEPRFGAVAEWQAYLCEKPKKSDRSNG